MTEISFRVIKMLMKVQGFTNSRHLGAQITMQFLGQEHMHVVFRCRFRFHMGNYGSGDTKGKICVVFEFRRLRTVLNRTMEQSFGATSLMYSGVPCRQIFSINYGMCKYVDRNTYSRDSPYLANPIDYANLKDSKYAAERELRISLSALGLGHFVLNDGTRMEFPTDLRFGFDF